MTKFQQSLESFRKKAEKKSKNLSDNYRAEEALLYLLNGFEEPISEFSSTCEGSFELFHKGFRQIDITDTPGVDAAIWSLIKQSEIAFIVWSEVYETDLELPDSEHKP